MEWWTNGNNIGWIEDFASESVQTVASAYLERGDHNISELILGGKKYRDFN
jgi:hypothetical protein